MDERRPVRAGDDGGSDGTTDDEDDDLTNDDSNPPDEEVEDVDDLTDHPRRARNRLVAGTATAAAFALVMFALISPNDLGRLTAGSFARVPAEGLLGVLLVLLLPRRTGRLVAALGGLGLGLLTLLKLIDTGSVAVIGRPFNLVLDGAFLPDGAQFLTTSLGRIGGIAAMIGLVALVLTVPLLITWAALRLTRLVVRHDTTATAAVAALGVVWVTCAGFGVHIVPGQPVAARTAALLTKARASRFHADLQDHKVFARQAAVDAFRDTPGDQLLTGLRGKDFVLAVVESYGRSAVLDPKFAPQVDAVLDAGSSALRAKGFAARSGWLTSPTAGGGSVLAHATLLSGLWIDNRQRYHNLTTSNRLTLNGAFRRADWRTVAVVPGVTETWAEGSFFGYDKIYAEKDLGYRGPKFGWATMTDQYVMSAFERSEHSASNHAPVMAEIPLVSSHVPWAPIPSLVDWDEVGDGSVFNPMPAAGRSQSDVWRSRASIRTEYRRSIEYSLNTLISYVETYGDDDLVLVFFGDHQPIELVTGKGASRDVPITIVAKDPAVLDRVSGWGWDDGLKPGATAPVWPMSDFRDRFLTAFGPRKP